MSKAMSVAEVKFRRSHLERDLMRLVHEFEMETRVQVRSIEVQHVETTALQDTVQQWVVSRTAAEIVL